MFSSTNFPGTISDHLVFTRKFINEHPEKVQAIVDSWFDTLTYINTNKNKGEVTDIMAKQAGLSVADYKEDANGAKISPPRIALRRSNSWLTNHSYHIPCSSEVNAAKSSRLRIFLGW